MLQIAILLALVRVSIAENIIRHSCGSEVEFYRIASDHALADQMSFTFESTTGLTGCIDACVGNSTCKAFNAKKITENNAQCELLPNDRNTNAAGIVARAGWHYYDTGLYASKVILAEKLFHSFWRRNTQHVYLSILEAYLNCVS